MRYFVSILIFLILKAGQAGAAYYFMLFFQMKYDIWVAAFYGGASLFQFAFYLYAALISGKGGNADILIKRNSSTITYFMELVAVGASLYYLFMLRNPVLPLEFIFVVAALIGNLFFAVHKTVLSFLIRNSKIKVHSSGIISNIIFLFFAFAVPIAYIAAKEFYYREKIDAIDIYLITGALFVNWIVVLWLTISKNRRGTLTARTLHPVDVYIDKDTTKVFDDCEIGYIQTEIKELFARLIREKENIMLFNNYTSAQIREHAVRYGIEMNGETKTATIATFIYDVPKEITDPQEILRINNRIVRIIGEMSGDYDGYPYFYHNHAIVIFGIPFYFDHQKYNAVECATRIIWDIYNFAGDESLRIDVSTGIFTGPIVYGTMNTPGKNLKEIRAVGASIDNSYKIAAISKNLKVKLLTDNETIESLKTKFYVQKTYKIKLDTGEMMLLNQVKA
ncbi:MAG: hypothetical protein A2014_03775 [Spirochaetes bacterium GWF1_49_6]|nr:MAG: hypothetical protein A2014_03775 [Spirochaetes bacterium GWF1_49_6]